jgi:hypothetical protein
MGRCAIWRPGGVVRLKPVAHSLLSSPCLLILLGRATGGSCRSSTRFVSNITIGSSASRSSLAARLIVLGSKVSSEFPGLRGFSFVDADLDPLSALGL